MWRRDKLIGFAVSEMKKTLCNYSLLNDSPVVSNIEIEIEFI